jgi:hypothetical protein
VGLFLPFLSYLADNNIFSAMGLFGFERSLRLPVTVIPARAGIHALDSPSRGGDGSQTRAELRGPDSGGLSQSPISFSCPEPKLTPGFASLTLRQTGSDVKSERNCM